MHGVDDGPSFPLDERLAFDGQWLIGRRPGLAISLRDDPYVSRENAVVRREADRFTIEDLPDSKNGTSVNGQRLQKGRAHVLATADVIGVGRSLLVFSRG